ncbi:MAG: hypothetical protein IEMM0003_0982 [bacterium]|nr:MAG: hypothetical protein IEMM0003_0982 [bacterium]
MNDHFEPQISLLYVVNLGSNSAVICNLSFDEAHLNSQYAARRINRIILMEIEGL